MKHVKYAVALLVAISATGLARAQVGCQAQCAANAVGTQVSCASADILNFGFSLIQWSTGNSAWSNSLTNTGDFATACTDIGSQEATNCGAACADALAQAQWTNERVAMDENELGDWAQDDTDEGSYSGSVDGGGNKNSDYWE